jgi:EAL domain-containing protein (putative c-di-GMP-specific phosphodiesterase class I)
VNGSIGVAPVGRDSGSTGEVMAHADLACHIAKGKGRNQAHLFQPEADAKVAAHLDLGWSARLQEALHSGGFLLHYQPILALDGSGAATHHETLLRLTDPQGGVIYPGSFLPTAERFNLMGQIDLWVIAAAMQCLASQRDNGRPDATLSVNLSSQALNAESLVPEVERLLAHYRLNAGALVFELTEADALADLTAANRLLNRLRDLGCRSALDDFGTGFSSFHHLKHLPVDFIKIDGQFIQGMGKDQIDRAIVASINDVAHSFGRRTIAESVEDRQVFEMLRGVGVDYVQGYYVARPSAQIETAIKARGNGGET